MTEYILNPGDIITVAGDNPLGCLGALIFGLAACIAVVGGGGAAINEGYKDKKPDNLPTLQSTPEIQQGIKDKQEYIIDPDRIEIYTPSTNPQLENIIDPDAISATFLLNKSRRYQALKTGGYNPSV